MKFTYRKIKKQHFFLSGKPIKALDPPTGGPFSQKKIRYLIDFCLDCV